MELGFKKQNKTKQLEVMLFYLKANEDLHLPVPFPNPLTTASVSTWDQAFQFAQMSESLGGSFLCACLIPTSTVSISSIHIAPDDVEMETHPL